MERNGIGAGLRVVLYSAGSIMWATRVWWMLRAYGFEAAVLDGGFEKWVGEGRPVSTEAASCPRARFDACLRPGLFVDKHAVLEAIGDEETVLINALAEEFYRGDTPSRYGRRGRIPGSVSVPAASLLDPETHAFLPPEAASERFDTAGVNDGTRVIAYCGGGISATRGSLPASPARIRGAHPLRRFDGRVGQGRESAHRARLRRTADPRRCRRPMWFPWTRSMWNSTERRSGNGAGRVGS